MIKNKTPQNENIEATMGNKKRTLLNKVKSVNLMHADASLLDDIKNKVIDNPSFQDNQVKNEAKELVAKCIKLQMSAQHPDLYKGFAKMDYDQIMSLVDKSKINGTASDMLSIKIPDNMLVTLPNGASAPMTDLYGTSFSISPNSFWANITNILNEVSVGDNYINTGDSFNAWTFYRGETLASGEADLVTEGLTISGVCLLNQNALVPANTQMAKGYQASLGVFINVDDAQDVGGGQGIGLFTMYSTPINVIKLAVTNPRQFAEMVRIFEATAVNTREYSLWMITTYNMLANITNYVVDNYNTNIRNCLNGTLFPAIQIMKNPTNEFNCGLISTYELQNTGSSDSPNWQFGAQDFSTMWQTEPGGEWFSRYTGYTIRGYSGQSVMSPDGMSQLTFPTFTSPYLVSGNNTYPRIQTSTARDIHLIISPEFFVGLKSGTLSQLFHWEYQRLEEYIPPENIHMLYKMVEIQASDMNTQVTDNVTGLNTYVWRTNAQLGERWFPRNWIIMITKPSDPNQWTAKYGWVWTTDMRNEWGAGMISTSFLHYAIYGGVIPWSNGCIFIMKNLMNFVSDQTQAVMHDFALGVAINQGQTVPGSSGSGQD